jgi:L-fucose isomerase
MNDRLFCQIPRPKIGIRVVVDGRCNGVREKIEAPTFALAQKAKELLESHVFHADGQPLECVIGSVGVGGVREAALVAQEFSQENVGAVISISRAFAYAAEVMVYDDQIPQAIWGFSGSERPGSVYLAAAVAVAEQKGVPIFKIYGQDVQDADDISVPQDVAKKLVLFAQCALAVSTMRNKAYLSVGNVCMGIGASIVDQEFFRCYLGMRTETVDMSEVQRRLQLNLFDPNEYQRAMAWTKANCTEMEDPNPPEIQQSRQQKDEVWSTIVKMTLILRDLMVGNPELEKLGWKEEAHGHYALMAGFQGQRQWTDFMPNGDFSEAILNSSFDWDGPRRPYTLATENDSLNAVTMLWGTLLTGTAQMFCDVRAYWSPEALAKTGRRCRERIYLFDQFRRRCFGWKHGFRRRRPSGYQTRLGDDRDRYLPLSGCYTLGCGKTGYIPRRRIFFQLFVQRRRAFDHDPPESFKRSRACVAVCRRRERRTSG